MQSMLLEDTLRHFKLELLIKMLRPSSSIPERYLRDIYDGETKNIIKLKDSMRKQF